ncbi:MAG: hypothetical protein O6948_03775 [Deltaproteobacteria bacterium]|nr:hypothetical protein [Deltaproteobacteria bacterium]
MDTDFTPTLRRVLGELQALGARIDQQITVNQRVIRFSAVRQRIGKQSTKKVRSPALVGYVHDRQALLKHKRLRKSR